MKRVSDYYAKSPTRNPKGPTLPEKPEPFSLDFSRQKAVRGGSWSSGAHGMRATIRTGDAPAKRHTNVGFRCAEDPK